MFAQIKTNPTVCGEFSGIMTSQILPVVVIHQLFPAEKMKIAI